MNSVQPMTVLPELDEPRSGAADEAGFGALATERGCLPLTALSVRARLCGLTAEVTIEQTFVNALAEELLEATYIFPLPDRGAVIAFRMEVAGRVVEGTLKERAAAREEYAQAIQEGHRAAIAEENRPDVFSMRVGNLPPREQAKVILTLVGPLEYADGEATFRFPLVVAPRYIPGEPLNGPSAGPGMEQDTDLVPDASCISPPVLLPGFRSPVRLSLEVEIDPAGIEVSELRSSLHSVGDEAAAGGVRRVKLVPGERLNRDFLLRFAVGQSQIKPTVALAPDAAGDEGTFQLTLLPPATLPTSARPRDVVLILDRSGSMGGWKMVAARRAAARIVDSLATHDRFGVFAFDNVVAEPEIQNKGRLLEATDRHRFRAVEFLSRLEARGGTEMAEALARGTKALLTGDPSRDRVLVLVTDGQVGNEDHLLAAVSKQSREMRIFTVGIDQAVNAGFLRRLAAVGGGACDLIESEERLDEVMDKIHRRISAPLLTGVQIRLEGATIDATTLTPARLPDLHAGVPLVVSGRYGGAKAASLLVEGKTSSGESWSAKVPAHATDSRAISALWARGRIRDLEDQYAVEGRGVESLERLIVATSLRWSVLSRFTAFVAVDRAAKVESGQPRREIVQPVEMPEGWADPTVRYCHAMAPAAGAVPMLKQSAATFGEHTWGGKMRKAMRSSSLLGSIFGRIDPGEVEEESTVPLDLAAYRARAVTWLKAAAAHASRNSRLEYLRELKARLTELIADLESVSATAADVQPLKELLMAVEKAVGQPSLPDEELAQIWEQVERQLTAFAGPAAPRQFWKQRS